MEINLIVKKPLATVNFPGILEPFVFRVSITFIDIFTNDEGRLRAINYKADFVFLYIYVYICSYVYIYMHSLVLSR